MAQSTAIAQEPAELKAASSAPAKVCLGKFLMTTSLGHCGSIFPMGGNITPKISLPSERVSNLLVRLLGEHGVAR